MPSASATSAGQPIGVTPPASSTSPGAGESSLPPSTTGRLSGDGPPPPLSGQGPLGQPGGQAPTPGGQPCCESGRPVLTDPITGQTVCSCQYDNHILNYQRLAASGGLPLGMYNPAAASAYGAAAADGAFLQGLGPEQLQSAFYPPGGPNGFDLKENLEAWRNLPYAASMYYPYDGAALAGYPFGNGYGMDLNGARRKNATRETTSTLKAWLSEHRKNPYPTKGEKIMLAIITKMTLTQVSTWFANARRRLKKENKMTWSPRNRCDDDEAADAEAEKNDRTDSGNEGRPSSRGSRRGRDEGDSDIVDIEEDSNPDGDSPRKRPRRSGSPASSDPGSLSDSDLSQSGHLSRSTPPNHHHMSHLPAHLHPLHHHSHHHLSHHTIPSNKPRIWSVVDMATNSSSSSGASPLSSPVSGPPGMPPLPLGGSKQGPGGHPGHLGVPTSGPPVSMANSVATLAAQNRARLDYLASSYPKGVPGSPASWYSPASFGMASPAAFSPLYSSSMLGHLAAGGPGGAPPTASQLSAHESSLNRLRSAAAAAALMSSTSSSSSADTIAAINKTITSIGGHGLGGERPGHSDNVSGSQAISAQPSRL